MAMILMIISRFASNVSLALNFDFRERNRASVFRTKAGTGNKKEADHHRHGLV